MDVAPEALPILALRRGRVSFGTAGTDVLTEDMRWLALVLLIQAAAAAPPEAPPVDPLDDIVGTWEGTATTTQRGQCSMNGQREHARPIRFAVRREPDGEVRAGLMPPDYTGPVGLEWKVEVHKKRLRFTWPKTITCGSERREALERMMADFPKGDGEARTLRLRGISQTCPSAGCVFGETIEVVWKGPPPPRRPPQ